MNCVCSCSFQAAVWECLQFKASSVKLHISLGLKVNKRFFPRVSNNSLNRPENRKAFHKNRTRVHVKQHNVLEKENDFSGNKAAFTVAVHFLNTFLKLLQNLCGVFLTITQFSSVIYIFSGSKHFTKKCLSALSCVCFQKESTLLLHMGLLNTELKTHVCELWRCQQVL